MTAEVAEVEAVTEFQPGDLVRVHNDLSVSRWHHDDPDDSDLDPYRADRPFDFGEVEAVNADGTVEVAWYSAGCSCDGTRTERPGDLTKATDVEYDMYSRGVREGYDRGNSDAKAELRRALGLTETADEDDN